MNAEAEFEAMMRANGPKIYTLAIRLCGNEAEGHDLAQDTFIKAWEYWGRFRGEADPGTWLYRICVNQWKNRVRSLKRRFFWNHFSVDGGGLDDDAKVPQIASREAPLSASLETRERDQKLQEALAQLPEEDRAILILREIDEKSYEEIAELLDIPVGTVRSRLSRGREKLRALFENLTEMPK